MNQGKPIPKYGPKPEMAKVMAALDAKRGADVKQVGVQKDSEGKVKPGLTPAEQARYANIFTIFKKIVFPGPEAGQVDRGNKKVAKIGGTQQMQQTANKTMSAGSQLGIGALGGILLAMLPKMVTTLGATIVKGISAIFSGKKLFDLISNSKLAKAMGSMAQGIGGAIKSLFEFGKRFSDGKFLKNLSLFGKSFDDVFKGFSKIFGKITKPIMGLGKAVFSGGKMFAKMAGGVGKILGKTLRFIPVIGSLFNFATAIEAAGNGEYGRSVIEVIAGIANIIPGGQLVSGLLNGATLLYDLFSENETGEGLRDLVGKGGGFLKDLMGQVWGGIKNVFSGIGEWVSGMFTGLGDMLKNVYSSAFDFFSNIFRGAAPILGFNWGDMVANGIDALKGANNAVIDFATGGAEKVLTGSVKKQVPQDAPPKAQKMSFDGLYEQELKETQAYRMQHLKMVAETNAKLDALVNAVSRNSGGGGFKPIKDGLQGQYYAGA